MRLMRSFTFRGEEKRHNKGINGRRATEEAGKRAGSGRELREASFGGLRERMSAGN